MAAAAAMELGHSGFVVQLQALRTLQKSQPEDLAPHATAVAQRLRDDDAGVQKQACNTLRHQQTADDNAFLRIEMLKTLVILQPADLAQHADAAAQCFGYGNVNVRCEALITLRRLHPADLALHAAAVAQCLQDKYPGVRKEALKTLQVLQPAELALHVDAVAHCLGTNANVRAEALKTLQRLQDQLVLTAHLGEREEEGIATVCCTTMSGDEVAEVSAVLAQPVSELRASLARELPGEIIQLMLPDGRVLFDDMILGDMLDCGQCERDGAAEA